MTSPGPSNWSVGADSRFATTRWNLVVEAVDWKSDATARRVMGELAQMYWIPLYSYLRSWGNSPAEAEDLVQGFFLHLLEKNALASVDRSKGKFRSFLLASLKHYLSNQRERNRAQKRGGGLPVISLDTMNAEEKYALEPVDAMTPERLFDRRWALEVLDHSIASLRADYVARGQEKLFAALEPALVSNEPTGYVRIAEELNMTEGAVKVAAHRMRRRYRELLRNHISQTVADPGMIDDEIRDLLSNL